MSKCGNNRKNNNKKRISVPDKHHQIASGCVLKEEVPCYFHAFITKSEKRPILHWPALTCSQPSFLCFPWRFSRFAL